MLDDVPRAGLATYLIGGGEDAAAHAHNTRTTRLVVPDDELIDAVAEMELYLAFFFCLKEWFAEDAHHLRARAPREVKARNGITVTGRVTRAALCPSDGRQDVEA